MRRERSKTHPAASTPRPSRRIDSGDEDPFATSGKTPEPAACASCGAVLRAGRWTWAPGTSGATPVTCPACKRIQQNMPDGVVVIAGAYARAHDQEIRGRIRHVEENEKQDHPLSRTFGIAEEEGALVVRTTERRLADSIARALERTFGGELKRSEGDRGTPLRLHWHRD